MNSPLPSSRRYGRRPQMTMLSNGKTRRRGLLSLAWVALAIAGCDRAEEPPVQPKPLSPKTEEPSARSPATPPGQAPAGAPGPRVIVPALPPYDTPERSQTELEAGLRSACEAGHAQGTPLLIEFSAPWCGDCRRLAAMKQEQALKDKLSQVPHYVVNIGRFDRHEGILEDFQIRAIANWQVVGTTDCSRPAGEWTRIAARTLEPATGKKEITADDLAAWLGTHFDD